MAASEQAEAIAVASLRPARLAITLIFFTNGLVLANWIARIPDVKQRLGLGEGALGIALLAMAVGALVAQLAAGWLARKFGTRRVTIAMAMLFCVAATLPGNAPSLPWLMLALFAFGAGNGGLDVGMNAQAALVEQRYTRPIMASFHGLWSVGGLLGASIGGVLAAQGVQVGRHLLFVAAFALVIIALAARWLVADEGAPAEPGAAFALPPRSLVPLGVVAFGSLFCEGAVADWSAVYLRDSLGSNPGFAAAGYAVFALLMTAGRLSGDWLTTRLGAALLMRGGGALITVGIGAVVLSNAPPAAIFGFGLIGAGAACLFPLVLSAAARTPDVATGTAIAAMATAGYSGFLVGPPLIGSLAELLTLRVALGLLGLVGVLIIVLSPAVQRRQ